MLVGPKCCRTVRSDKEQPSHATMNPIYICNVLYWFGTLVGRIAHDPNTGPQDECPEGKDS